MKAYTVVIFIFSVLLGLAIICAIFPEDGIEICGVKFEFPSLMEALTPAEAPGDDEDEGQAMDEKLKSISSLNDKGFIEFCKKSPTRIFMPKGDITYLDELFEAMDNASETPVRIMHFGDSQLEGDRMTASLRQHFQNVFGGGGMGWLAAQRQVDSRTVTQSTSPELKRYCPFGTADMHLSNGHYGPWGISSHVSGSATFNILATKNPEFSHVHTFNKITVAMMGQGSASANVEGVSYNLQAENNGSGLRLYSVVLPKPTRQTKVSVSGNIDVFGILCDNTTGISMDNIAMRGCSGTIFTSIAENTIAPFFELRNVELIILQFGGNYMPSISSQAQLEVYCKQIKKQLQFFHRIAPGAKILFIGPSDMSTSIKGKLQTYPLLPNMVKMLREVSNEEGCAFWDMFTAMGGNGSMIKWVNATPALAGADYVHFTPKGAQKISDLLFNTLKLYYNNYRQRHGKKGMTESVAKEVTVQFTNNVKPKQAMSPKHAQGSAGDEDVMLEEGTEVEAERAAESADKPAESEAVKPKEEPATEPKDNP